MAENKTKPTGGSVKSFIDGIEDDARRKDCRAIMKIMKDITGKPPKMWGPSIVGYGKYTYKYDTGRTGDWFLTGFSPRKQALTLYVMAGFSKYDELMGKLGKYKTGKSCLYIKSLDDVHMPTLKRLIRESANYVKKTSA